MMKLKNLKGAFKLPQASLLWFGLGLLICIYCCLLLGTEYQSQAILVSAVAPTVVMAFSFIFIIFVIKYLRKESDILCAFANDLQNEKISEIPILDFDGDKFRALKCAMNSMAQSLNNANASKNRALNELQSQAIELFKQRYELDEARHRYKTIFDQSIHAIALIDPDSKNFIEFNKPTCEMLGFNANELSNITIDKLEYQKEQKFTNKRIEDICEIGSDDFETRFIKKDGSFCDVQVIARTIELHGKSFIQLTMRDVTLRKKLYLELIEEKNRFKELFNASPIALALINEDLQILALNPTFSINFGYSMKDVKTLKALCDLTICDNIPYAINACKLAIAEANETDGSFITPTFKIKRQGGQIKYIRISGSIINDGYITAFSDVTESVNYEKSLKALNDKLAFRVEEETQKRMISEQTLIQSEKMAQLGNMIGIILHQWKQPLSAISLFAQELKLAYKFNDLDKDLIYSNTMNILAQVDFMAKTADEFQDFYRPSKEKKEFFVKRQIEIVASILAKQIALEDITLNIQGDEALTSLGFEGEFKQVILNLINNAKEALIEKKPKEPLINIEIFEKDTRVMVVISDNAGGVLPELLPNKIFEPFISAKGKKEIGVGLSLCKTIVNDRLNGSISACNTDVGAEFTLGLQGRQELYK